MIAKQFYLPNSITQDILDDLKQNFGNEVEFILIEKPFQLVYRAEQNKFYLQLHSEKEEGYAIGSFGLAYDNGKPKIFGKKNNKDGFSIVSYDRDQMFGIQDPDTKRISTKIYDFLKEKYDIDIKVSTLNTSYAQSQFLFSFDCINPKINFKNPITIDADLYNFLSNKDFTIGKFDNLNKLLEYEKELTVKMTIIAAFSKTLILEDILLEQENFIKNNNFAKGSYEHFVVESLIDKQQNWNSRQIDIIRTRAAQQVGNFVSNNMDIRRFFIGKNDACLDDDFGDMGKNFLAIFKFHKQYPQSSPTITKFLDILRNYTPEKLSEVLNKDDNLSVLLKENLAKKTNEILLPQGVSTDTSTLYNSININEKNFQKISILANSLEEKGEIGYNNLNIQTTNIANKNKNSNELTETAEIENKDKINQSTLLSFFEHRSYDTKSVLDISNIENIDQKILTKLAKRQTGYIIDKINENRNLECPKIKLDDNTIAYILSPYHTDIDITFDSVNDIIASKKNDEIFANYCAEVAYQLNNASVKNTFLNTETELNSRGVKKKFLNANWQSNIQTIFTEAKKAGESKIFPIQWTTNIHNQEPYYRNPNKNSQTEYDKIMEEIYAKEIYSAEAKPYNLSDPQSNVVQPNLSFIDENSARLLGVPLSIDLSTKENKEIFFKISLESIKEYAKVANISDEDIDRMTKQTANLIFDENSHKAIVTGGSVIEAEAEVTPKNIPIEFLTVGTKDYEILGTLPTPYNFFVEKAKEMGYISLNKDRLKIPALNPQPIAKIVKQNVSLGDMVFDAVSKIVQISPEKIKEAATNILLDGQTVQSVQRNKFGGIDVRKIDSVLRSNDQIVVNDMELLLNVARQYYLHHCKYPTKQEIKNELLSAELFKKIKTSHPTILSEVSACIDELYNTCAIEEKRAVYDKNLNSLKGLIEKAYELNNQKLPKDKQVKKIKDNAEGKINKLHVNMLRSIKIRDGIVEDAIKRTALAFIHFANFNLLNEDYKKIEELKETAKLALAQKDPNLEDINNALKSAVKNFVINGQTAFFTKYSAKDAGDKKPQEATSNKLKHYQAQAIINVFLDPIARTINIIFPPRQGKSRAGFGIGLHLLNFDDNEDKVFFYSQTKNMDDIINQMIDSYPEFIGVLKLQNYENKNKFYNDDMISYYIDKTPIASIPRVLSNILEKKVSAENNDSMKYNLLNKFDKIIRSMLTSVKDKSDKELTRMFKDKEHRTQNPYYSLYESMKAVVKKISKDTIFQEKEKELFNPKVVAAMTLYIAKLKDDGYLTDENVKAVTDTMLQWYSCAISRVKNTEGAKIVIASKYDLNKEIPTQEALMLISDKQKEANTQTLKAHSKFKFSGGAYDIKLEEIEPKDNEKLIFSLNYNSQDNILVQNLISDALNNISLTDDSSLLKNGNKNKIVIIPNHKKEKNIIKNILTKIENELTTQEIMNRINTKGTAFYNTILESYKDAIASIFVKNGIEIQHAKTFASILSNHYKQDLIKLGNNIFRSLGLKEQNIDAHLDSINDIKINGENLPCYVFKLDKDVIEEYKKYFSSSIRKAVSDNNSQIAKTINNIATEIGANELKIQEEIISSLEEINDNLAKYHNEKLFKEQYRLAFLPKIVPHKNGDSSYSVENQSDVIARLDEKNEAYNIAYNFTTKNDYFYHKCVANHKNNSLSFIKCKALGSKYDLESNMINISELKDYNVSMEINRDVNKTGGHNISYNIVKTKDIYEFASNKNKDGYSFAINSNLLLEEDKKRIYSLTIMDEYHKNENEKNPYSLSGLALTKIDSRSKKLAKLSGTPPIKMPSAFSILDIKSQHANLLIYLYRNFPEELNNLSKGATLNYIKDGTLDIKAFRNGLMDIRGLPNALIKFLSENYDFYDPDVDPSKFKNNEQELGKKILEVLPKEINGVIDLMEDAINGVKQYIAKDINKTKTIRGADIPNFKYDSKEFCEKYIGNIDNKFNIEKICISSRIMSAHFQNTQKTNAIDIVRSPKITYNVKMEHGDRNFRFRQDKYFPALFTALHNYSIGYKLPNMRRRIDCVVDAFFDSLKNTTELSNDLHKGVLKNEKENLIADKNLDTIKKALLNSGLKLSYEDLILSKTKTNNTSAQELTKEILKNNGVCLKLDKFEDYYEEDSDDPDEIKNSKKTKEKEKALLEKKVAFIKQHIIPNIADIINKPDYIEQITNMAINIADDEEKTYAYGKTSSPYIVMFNKNVIMSNEISYQANLYIDNDCILRDTQNGKKIFFNHTVSFDNKMVEDFFPTLSKYIDNFEPFQDLVSDSKQSFYAYSILSNNNFRDFLHRQHENNFKYPIYTERIASNLFTNLIVLEETIKEQERAVANNQIPKNKTIFTLATNPAIAKIIDAIDKKTLKSQYNIDYIAINKTNEFQAKIDNLKAENKNPDILILPKKQIAEGNQIYGFTLGDKTNWNTSVFADGIEASKDIKTTIQAISRVDSQDLRNQYEEITGSKNFCFNIMLFGYKASYKKDKHLKPFSVISSLENNISNGIADGKGIINLSRQLSHDITFEGKTSNAIVRVPYALNAYAGQFTSALDTSDDFAKICVKTLDTTLTDNLTNNYLTPNIEANAVPLIANAFANTDNDDNLLSMEGTKIQ